jgi:hypothetical protein
MLAQKINYNVCDINDNSMSVLHQIFLGLPFLYVKNYCISRLLARALLVEIIQGDLRQGVATWLCFVGAGSATSKSINSS